MMPTAVAGGAARRLLESGPLLSPDGSDSLSLDEALEVLVATGWSLEAALLALVPEAAALRPLGHPLAGAFGRRVAGFLAPWDGPAALVFGDGRRVGALVDRNGLRPLAFAVTADRLVAVASEAGAVPLPACETVRRGRLGPGELLLVDPRRGAVLEDVEAKTEVLRRSWRPDAPRATFVDRAPPPSRRPTRAVRRPRRRSRCDGSRGSMPSAPASTSGRWWPRRASRSGAWATTRRPRAERGSTGRSSTTFARRSPRSPTHPSTRSASGR